MKTDVLPRHYANAMSTVAVFLALGGGAWAASGGLGSSSGEVRGCVPERGGVLRIVRPHARCRRGEQALTLARAPKKGPTGPAGPQGPAGSAGPLQTYSFSLGPFLGGSASASFGGNYVRFNCEASGCSAQVLASGVGAIFGVDERGALNGPVTTTNTIFAETPATVTLTAISSGSRMEGDGRAMLWLQNGTGWEIELHVVPEPSASNMRLFGTAIPMAVNECAGHMDEGGPCPPLKFTGG